MLAGQLRYGFPLSEKFGSLVLGKSSVVERICKVRIFPRAANTATRMPVELCLHRCNDAESVERVKEEELHGLEPNMTYHREDCSPRFALRLTCGNDRDDKFYLISRLEDLG